MDDVELFWKTLVTELSALPHRHQLAFAASCCERSYPNYVVFNGSEGWGDPRPLRDTLDSVWSFIAGRTSSTDQLAQQKRSCEAVIPDLENFSSMEAAAAQEAGFSILVLLEYVSDPSPRHAVRISTFSRDTIDMAVQLRNELDSSDPEFERRILQDPLMQREFDKQERDLAELKAIRNLDEVLLGRFRASATADGESNIGLR